jgi:hypothetical protein
MSMVLKEQGAGNRYYGLTTSMEYQKNGLYSDTLELSLGVGHS